MTTVYWRKDEPDDFQVKDINVPGVFPRPSLKLNSSSVTTTVKPWLRPRSTRTSGSKHEQSTRNQGASLGNVNQTAPLAGETKSMPGDKPKLASHGKVSASLKDLSFEDKKRVANLIKELAKAGEERKLAVNALHQERTLFQGKEESLKRQQEKLISERDELREKILEYQFLINQYSRQIQHEKEEPNAELKEGAGKERQISTGNARERGELLNIKGNLKPSLPIKDLDEEIQTYYSVPASTDSRHDKQMPVCSKQDSYTEDRSKTRELANELTQANASLYEAKPSEDKLSTQANAKPDPQYVPVEKCDDKSDSEVQRKLLEQQSTLLGQQKMIQQQLENLQVLQQKYAEEFSQIITYSEDLKQVMSAERKATEIDRQDEIHPAMIDTSIRREIVYHDEHSIAEEKHIRGNRDVGNGSKQAGIQLAVSPGHGLDAKNHSRGTRVADNKHLGQRQLVKLDSYVNKSIEQIPGYLLHTDDAQLQEKSVLEVTPKMSDLSHSNGEDVHKSRIYESEASPAGKLVAHQCQPAMKQELFTHVPYDISPRSKSSLPLQSSMLSRKSSDSIANSNVENSLSHHEPPGENIKGKICKSKKQYSLLHSFEDFENEHPNCEDDNFLNPGSYTGFARSILEGKYRNEQIFASTDYSDDESEQEDNELIADMFFLKRP